MNAFITGATGFIGSRLVEFMANNSQFQKIYCLCRSKTNLPHGIIPIYGSLKHICSIAPIDADVCIHLAAVTNSQNPGSNEVFKTNADGTSALIDFCKKSSIRKIVFLSSINVYLQKKYEYALSKLSAEEHIRTSELEYSILRCSLVYGRGCDSFDKIIGFAKAFHIVPVLGNGKAYEQPIYIDEVCKAIIHHTSITGDCETCDLFGKTKMSYNKMVKLLAAAIGKKVFLLHLPIKPVSAISEFCYRHKIPFPIQPEQISHMCEDLCSEHSLNESCDLDDFTVNLKKYI